MYAARPIYTMFGLATSSSALVFYNKIQSEFKTPCEIYYNEDSPLNKHLMSHELKTGMSQIEAMLRSYTPSWFYFSQITGCIAAGLLHDKHPFNVQFDRLDKDSESLYKGKMTYHIKKNIENTKRNKALLLVPGVGGDCKSFLV